jgi:hypothetical protein
MTSSPDPNRRIRLVGRQRYHLPVYPPMPATPKTSMTPAWLLVNTPSPSSYSMCETLGPQSQITGGSAVPTLQRCDARGSIDRHLQLLQEYRSSRSASQAASPSLAATPGRSSWAKLTATPMPTRAVWAGTTESQAIKKQEAKSGRGARTDRKTVQARAVVGGCEAGTHGKLDPKWDRTARAATAENALGLAAAINQAGQAVVIY